MSIRVLAENAENAFHDEDKALNLIDLVYTTETDVAFFPQAYDPRHEQDAPVQRSIAAFRKLGYTVIHHANGDTDGRPDPHGFIGVSRSVRTLRAEPFDIGPRTGYRAFMQDPKTRDVYDIKGVHAVDRPKDVRDTQFNYIQRSHNRNILLGTLGTMHADSTRARAARLFTPVADRLPQGVPGTDQTKLERFGSLAERTAGMADGTVLQTLEAQGYYDLDERRQATSRIGSIPAFQLQYILGDRTLEASEGVMVHRGLGISRHDPISAEVQVRQ